MDKDAVIGATAMGVGSTVTSCAAPAAYTTESTMLLILSGVGVLATISGLIYTIWNGNRNYNLAREGQELRKRELEHEDSKRRSHLTVVDAGLESA